MKAALIVLDGWGIGNHDRLNAVEAASTPVFDRLRSEGAYGTLSATGESVGLPADGLGNSEVGHLTIGAGRIVSQAHTRINRAIREGTFADREPIRTAIERARREDARLHLIGLLSDAGVHADIAHAEELVGIAARAGVECSTHAITDGRDTPPTSGVDYVERFEAVTDDRGTGEIATITGRYFAMDRDENWVRTERAFRAMVDRAGEHRAPDPVSAVEGAYAREETDEFITPTVIDGGHAIGDGDAVITFNFRADRMRQLVRMLAGIDPDWSPSVDPPAVELVTMTEYDASFDLPVVFGPHQPENTLGDVLEDHGLTQLRIAETEKYAHVTYFLNGGREIEFDGEHREIIPSPDVPTYDHQPEMNAPAVTNTAIEAITAENPDVLVLNYANPDMVGHTGAFEAAVTALETVDAELGRLVAVCRDRGAHVLVLADHGNADDMGTPEEPHTAHTRNPVPFIYLAPVNANGQVSVRPGGELSDVAPTLLDLLNLPIPSEMTGRALVSSEGRD